MRRYGRHFCELFPVSFAETALRCSDFPCLILSFVCLCFLAFLLIAIQDHLSLDSGNITTHAFHQLSGFLTQLRLIKLEVELGADQAVCRGLFDFGGCVGRGGFFNNVPIRVAPHGFES